MMAARIWGVREFVILSGYHDAASVHEVIRHSVSDVMRSCVHDVLRQDIQSSEIECP